MAKKARRFCNRCGEVVSEKSFTGGWRCTQCGSTTISLMTAKLAHSVGEKIGTRPPDPAKERKARAKEAAPDQGFCAACWSEIYAGDAICPEGHQLKKGWEIQFEKKQGVPPCAHPEGVTRRPEQPTPTGSASLDRVQALKDLADLHRSGALTDAEFQDEKARILTHE